MSALFWSSGREAVADYGSLLWKQLLLLGFNASEYARKEGIRDPDGLGPRMFNSQSPNRPGLFCILHFLFSAFSPEFAKAIAPCFPTYDAEGKKEFRSVASSLIQSMCEAKQLPREAAIRAGSILNVPEGVRVYQLCLQISTAVVQRVLTRDFPPGAWTPQATPVDETGLAGGSPSTATKPECVAVCRALAVRALRAGERFQERAAEIMAVQRHWVDTAESLAKSYTQAASDPIVSAPVPPRPSVASAAGGDEIELLKGNVEAGWRALDDFVGHPDMLSAKDVMSKFLHRTAHPSSHRVEAGPLRVCVGGRETVGAHTSPPLLSATKHFGRAASSLSGRMGGDTALRWLLKKHTHLEGARASAAQSAANIAAVNQGLRLAIVASRDNIARLRASRSSVLGEQRGEQWREEGEEDITPSKPERPQAVEPTPPHAYLPRHFASPVTLAAEPKSPGTVLRTPPRVLRT